MTELSIVIPVFNECESILNTIKEIRKALDQSEPRIGYELIIVDDGSNDGTGDILEGVTDIRLVSHDRNRGYGAALKSGIRQAGGEVIAITDADGTYPNWMIPKLYRGMLDRGNDMIVAARTGSKVHIPLIRRPAKIVLNLLANYMTNTRIPDLNSGLRLFRREEALKYFHIISDGFSFTTTITLAMLVNGYNVSFEPIDYAHRKGHSKIRPVHDTFNFLILIIRTIAFFNPLKVFIPVSLLLFLIAVTYLVIQLISGDVGDTSVILLLAALQIFLIGIIADLVVRKP